MPTMGGSVRRRFVVSGVFGLLVLALAFYSSTRSVDFEVYRQAGEQVLRRDFQLYPRGVYDGLFVTPHGFGYAPVVSFIFVPLALLSLEAGAFILVLLKVAALVHTVVLVARLVGVPPRHYARAGLLAFLPVAGYLAEEFRGGNVHFLTVWLLVLAIDLIERGRKLAPGVMLALVIAIKVTPVLFVLNLWIQKRRDVVTTTLGTLAVLFILPATVVGTSANAALIRGFVLYARYKVNGASNGSLRGLLVRLLTPNPVIGQGTLMVPLTGAQTLIVTFAWACLAVLIVVGLIVLMRRSPGGRIHNLLVHSAVLMAILLIAPHTQRIYFSWLFFPCCLFACLLMQNASPHRRLLQVALGAAFCVSSLLPAILPGRAAAFAYERLWPHAFLTLGLFTITIVLSTGNGEPRAPETHAS